MPRSIKFIVHLAALLVATASWLSAQSDKSEFHWPHGAKAAVCLTYDDAIASQLDVAIPQLNAAGLHGTFFLQANSAVLLNRQDEWVAAGKAGHELASHSAFHPCRRSLPGRDWVKPAYDLDNYTVERMSEELTVTNSFLHALDGETVRSYAYPCGEFTIDHGHGSYLELASQKYFAARGTGPGIDPVDQISFYNTPCLDASSKSVDDYIAYLEDAYEKGSVAVFMFHGVGGDYLIADGEAHKKLLDYLAANQDRFWTAPYLEVMQHVHSEYDRLGWPIKN